MTSFLFWNIMRKDLRALIAAAVVERDVDVLMLAESGTSDGDIVAALRESTGREYTALSEAADKVRLFSRLSGANWILRQLDPSNARMAIWSAEIGESPGILLATAHLVSKNNSSETSQALRVAELSKEVSRVEDQVDHRRTVLVGDLNMNPFEDGVTASHALHAVMTRRIAGGRERVVAGGPRRFFYNPMWGLFGDRTPGPAGTFYYGKDDTELFWHMLDQVLLRPALMNALDDLVILDRVGPQSLLRTSTGRPNKTIASDHLPLAFRLILD